MENINFNKDIDRKLKTLSISATLGLIAKPVDQEGMLEKTFNKHYNNPDSEYYHLSKEEIKAIWESKGAASRQYGSLLDDYIGIGHVIIGYPNSENKITDKVIKDGRVFIK